ncbi:MAG: diguanylate cyclase [Pseudomonadota bacterium]
MPGTVLIIDSQKSRAALLGAQLERQHYQVAFAHSGQMAPQAVAKTRPDTVIAATDLDDQCGYELISQLTKHPAMGFVPIFLFKDRPTEADHAQAFASGALALMETPVDLVQLRLRLPALMRGRRLVSELDLHFPNEERFGLAETPAPFAGPSKAIKFSTEGVSAPLISYCLEAGLELSSLAADCHLVGTTEGLAAAFTRVSTSTDLPTILVTETATEPLMQEALALGASDIIAIGRGAANVPPAIRYHAGLAASRHRKTSRLSAIIREAKEDAVSGALSRRYGERYLERAINDLSPNQSFTILMIDLDHFKAINDNWGHAAGDRILSQVTKAVTQTLRPDSQIIRWGGDEFVITCPEIGTDQITTLGQRVLQAVSSVITADDHSVSASFGAASIAPGQFKTRIVLLNEADRALYRAKENGRGRGEVA